MLYILIIIQAIIFVSQCVIDSSTVNTQYCVNSQKRSSSWGYTSKTQIVHLNATNYYDETTLDSGPIRLIRNSTTVDFEMVFYDKNFNNPIIVRAYSTADTATYTFAFNGLINNFLVIQRTTIAGGALAYFVFMFNTKSPISVNSVALTMTPAPPYELFIPFSSYQTASTSKLTVGVRKNTGGTITRYVVTFQITPTFSATVYPCDFYPQIAWDGFRGNEKFLFQRDPTNKLVIIYQRLPNNTFGFSGDMTIFNISYNTDLTLKSYPMRRGVTLISAIDETGTKGWIYPIKLTTGFFPWRINLAASTSAIVEYSDLVQNYMAVGSSEIYWYNLVYSDVNTSARIPTKQLSTANLLSVALSGNVATFLFSSKIEYYRIIALSTGAASISKIFETTYTATDITLTGTNQWKIAFQCVCYKMALGCYGSKFLCAVRRAALSSCF